MEILIVNIVGIIIQTIATIFIILQLSSKLYNVVITKRNTIYLSISILLTIILCTILKNFIPGINTILSVAIEVACVTIILKLKPLKSFLIIATIMAILATTEIIGVYTTMFIFNVEMSNLLSSPLKLLCTSLLQFVCIIGLVYAYLKITKTKPINFDFLNDINNKQILTIIALLIVYIIPQMLIFIVNSYSYPISLLVINSVQFILICIIAFVFVKNRLNYEKTQSELFTSELHNKTLVGMVDGVRTLKHDYNNIMQSLNGYVLTKQYDRLQDHIGSLLKECNAVNNLAVIDPKIFNEPAIYGIVGSKYFLADEKNITFEFDIVTDIASINFSMPDLSRILGILLDNAIEATQNSKEPYIRLEMHYDKRKCADKIKIYNTYDTSIEIDVDSIFKKGFSTKKIKSGIGLWEVKKIVSKNPHSQIYASVEGKHFVQNLIIEKADNYSDIEIVDMV